MIAYLEAENGYTDAITAHLEPLRQQIFDEIKARTKETDLSVPTRRGDYWYYARSFEGKQYGVQCRCPVRDPDDWSPPVLDEHTDIDGEEVLLDENVEADGHDFFALGAASVSLDGNVLAYSVDVVGDERYTLRFKNLRTGELYPDVIAGIAPGATWAADNATLYYMTVDDAWRPDTVWRHRLGAGLPAEKVYHEPDERFWLGVGRTRSDKYVMIASGSSITSEMFYADADRSERRVHQHPAATRRCRVLRRARGGRWRGPVPDPAQRRCGELHAGRGAGRGPHRPAHPDRRAATTSGSMASTRSSVIWWSATAARRCRESSCGPSPRTVSTAQPRTSSSTRS